MTCDHIATVIATGALVVAVSVALLVVRDLRRGMKGGK